GVYQDNGTSYSLVIETSWIKPNGPLGYCRVRWWALLGEYVSDHNLRLRAAFNYDDTWTEDITWENAGDAAGKPELLRTRFRTTKVASVRMRIEDVDNGSTAREASFKLVSLALSAAPKKGILRLPAPVVEQMTQVDEYTLGMWRFD